MKFKRSTPVAETHTKRRDAVIVPETVPIAIETQSEHTQAVVPETCTIDDTPSTSTCDSNIFNQSFAESSTFFEAINTPVSNAQTSLGTDDRLPCTTSSRRSFDKILHNRKNLCTQCSNGAKKSACNCSKYTAKDNYTVTSSEELDERESVYLTPVSSLLENVLGPRDEPLAETSKSREPHRIRQKSAIKLNQMDEVEAMKCEQESEKTAVCDKLEQRTGSNHSSGQH